MVVDSFLYTSTGGRTCNEDAVGKKNMEDGAVYVLADGLGGHRYGELASKCVVDTMLEESPREDTAAWLAERMETANKRLLAEQVRMSAKMKSTAAALVIRSAQAHWAHVGDSRIYYLHGDALAAVTKDHSVAYKKYQAGEITRAQIAFDEDQPSLLRALGSRDRCQAEFGCAPRPLEPGDGFFLCSDGVWEYLKDEEVLVDFLKAESAKEWAELLLLRVINRVMPGNDNLSLITVKICET